MWLRPAVGAGLGRMVAYASFVATSLLGLLQARKPDFIFVDSPPLFLSVPARLAARWWGVPYIFNVADLWPDSVRELGVLKGGPMLRMAEGLEAWSYDGAAFVTAVTEGIRDALLEEKGVPERKLLFLPNGVDTETFRPMERDNALARELGLQGQWVILYAGNHGYAQGLDVVLGAAQRLADENCHFVLVGGGSEKQRLVEQAQAMQLRNVSFLDTVPAERVAKLHSIAQTGLTSLLDSPLFEGARPAKTFATMACGKPVLYSGCGEGAQIVEEARAGIVVPPENPDALAQAIRVLKTDPVRAQRMGENGRRYVGQHHAWEALVEDWLDQLLHKRAKLQAARVDGPSRHMA